MKMAGGSQATRVKIGNQFYDLLGDDPDRLRALAELVDERMKLVVHRTPTVDTQRVAILAALSLADDLLEAKGVIGGPNPDLDERLENLAREVRTVLDSLAPVDGLPFGIE